MTNTADNSDPTESGDSALTREVLRICKRHEGHSVAAGDCLFFGASLSRFLSSPGRPPSRGETMATTTTASLKQAYKQLVLRLHPDKNSSPSAGEAFQAMQAVFEDCLSYVRSRAERDANKWPEVPAPDVFSREGFEGNGERRGARTSHQHRPPAPPPPSTSPSKPHQHQQWNEDKRSGGARGIPHPKPYPPPPPPPFPRSKAGARSSDDGTTDRSGPKPDDDVPFDIPLPPDVFAAVHQADRADTREAFSFPPDQPSQMPPSSPDASQASSQQDADEEANCNCSAPEVVIDVDELPSLDVSDGGGTDEDHCHHQKHQQEASSTARGRPSRSRVQRFAGQSLPSLSSSSSSRSTSSSSSSAVVQRRHRARANASRGGGVTERATAKTRPRSVKHHSQGRHPLTHEYGEKRVAGAVQPSLSEVLAAFDAILSSASSADEAILPVGDGGGGTRPEGSRSAPQASHAPSHARFTTRSRVAGVAGVSQEVAAAVAPFDVVKRRGERASTKGAGGRSRRTASGDAGCPPESGAQRCSCGRARKGMCFLCE